MSRLRHNIIATYSAHAWIALMSVIFVPLYLLLLGSEQFALVGIFLSLQSISLIFDFGMGSALNRELSQRSSLTARDELLYTQALVRTVERLTWCTALVLAIALTSLGPLAAAQWLNPETMTAPDIAEALFVIAIAVALSWPATVYAAALQGLERHIPLAVSGSCFATVRSVGAIPVIYLSESKLDAFLGWQLLVGAAYSMTLAFLLRRHLPRTEPAVFFWAFPKTLHRLAWGMFGISATAAALSQIDRLFIATNLPLADLGYYSVAVSLAAGLGRMVTPMFSALYPRFTRLLTHQQSGTLVALYHEASQWLASLIAAVAAIAALFTQDILYLWSGNSHLSRVIAVPTVLLILGSAFNGMINVPYALQLAAGKVRFALILNALALALAVPLCFLLTSHFGLAGAAMTWLAVNVAYFAALPWWISRNFDHLSPARWYAQDILPSILVATLLAFCARQMLPAADRSLKASCLLAIASLITLAGSCIATPSARAFVRSNFSILQKRP